jgi:hypothetical protein
MVEASVGPDDGPLMELHGGQVRPAWDTAMA